jgi:predicted acylesterase/phospholipase RssA
MKNIRLVLSGGGTRCAYQYKILEEFIMSDVYRDVNIDSVIGTSFGAVVGLYFCLGEMESLEKLFLSMNQDSLVKCFDLWGYDKYIRGIPIIGDHIGSLIDVVWIIESIKRKGLYKPNFGIEAFKSLDLTDKNKLKKFHCSVFNVTKSKLEFIRGDHPLIIDYIIASCALWLVFPPVEINRLITECDCNESCHCHKDGSELCHCENLKHRSNEFIDIGFVDQVPFQYDQDFDGRYYVITTKDYNRLKNNDFKLDDTGKHLFDYLDRIISYQSDYIQSHRINNHECWNRPNVTVIDFNCDSYDACDMKSISEYMHSGRSKSEYLIDHIRE